MTRLTRASTWAVLFMVGHAQAQMPAFEVASVKPSTSLDPNISMNRAPGGGFEAVNVPLQMLVTFAHDVREHQLAGAPAWLGTERYDVHAKAPPGELRVVEAIAFRR